MSGLRNVEFYRQAANLLTALESLSSANSIPQQLCLKWMKGNLERYLNWLLEYGDAEEIRELKDGDKLL